MDPKTSMFFKKKSISLELNSNYLVVEPIAKSLDQLREITIKNGISLMNDIPFFIIGS
jgi:hypothetical protein